MISDSCNAARALILLVLALCTTAGPAASSTREDIAALEAGKTPAGVTGVPAASAPAPAPALAPAPAPAPAAAPAPRWHAISGGARVDLNNWKVVIFMSSTCAFCHRYDPLVKQMANAAGIGVLAYSLDGQGDRAFPDPLTPTPEVMTRFFGPGIPVATPTSFLVNVHTLTAFPLLQGNQTLLMSRLDEVFHVALRGGLR
ncbi:type-F conjugative transfer system pilin assembly thiol-disulfide isomerase TrbB [Pantoea sp. M_9]|uniref:type-F conjugative transfer system pilin assembly thiol-disulfide isomerase TrbB n=1 Tax=Pantoea sp. M_9 TaxID=2608041 RepID=UPI001232AC35|nr:type-F conjugative transfer system pilin assembly thiol-disulfide isomerase TrbB [Pantoea sp. M_9]KAA5971644.1 type-F conjugative transfer system pilin assembly thiol-disulfide isomerase TrbB [Pantoea sp. M_9]